MKTSKKIAAVLTVISAALLLNGCVPQDKYEDLRLQNRTQLERIGELESNYNAAKLQLAQSQGLLAGAETQCLADTEALRKTVDAMQSDIEQKNALVRKMQAQLLQGGIALPPELSSKLEDFAKNSEMISYDPASGIVKFKSDLLFDKGSDTVAATAVSAVKQLCGIINSAEAGGFDVIIAGHTDDVPIRKPQTKALHPTNWHLSVHRAISVLNVMKSSGVDEKRLSVRGFGEFRPVEENKPKLGNPKNRRVEIYIVPAGA